MDNFSFNRDWYGSKASLISNDEDRTVIDYGCEGKGIITVYDLFEGVQLCFMDCDTSEQFHSQIFSDDVIQLTYCRYGRYECEFTDHRVSYLPEGSVAVEETACLPETFSFPLGKFDAVSIVIDRSKAGKDFMLMLRALNFDIDRLIDDLGLKYGWFIAPIGEKESLVFSQIYEAKQNSDVTIMRIKALEILALISRLKNVPADKMKYYSRDQISKVKDIRNRLIADTQGRASVEQLAKDAHISVSAFHSIFLQVYGETPYAYLKKYKMDIAAQRLAESDDSVLDIAAELGYSNASKFAAAFRSVYGMLPKDYRRTKKQERAVLEQQ